MRALSTDLPLSAQASYSELFDMALESDMAPLALMKGSFHKRNISGRSYYYFGFRDVDGQGRMAYVGPDNERVTALIARLDKAAALQREALLKQRAAATASLGCMPMLDKHFRIVQKLAAYGFFKAGGVLIGTHAFVAYANMLGIKWRSSDKTLDVDFAHAGKNISIALPANLKLSVHDALTSLEMGLLPIREFSGAAGAQYRNPTDPELRIDFLTANVGRKSLVQLPALGLSLEPLKFMEFSLEATTQAAAFGSSGACTVNVPDPARYAVHKLIVYGERPIGERAKSNKDIEQSAALVEWHIDSGQVERMQSAWIDAVERGPGWRRRAEQGRNELLRRYPNMSAAFAESKAAAPVSVGRRARGRKL